MFLSQNKESWMGPLSLSFENHSFIHSLVIYLIFFLCCLFYIIGKQNGFLDQSPNDIVKLKLKDQNNFLFSQTGKTKLEMFVS